MEFFKRRKVKKVRIALESLVQKGLVKKTIVEGEEQFYLTEEGLKEVEKMEAAKNVS